MQPWWTPELVLKRRECKDSISLEYTPVAWNLPAEQNGQFFGNCIIKKLPIYLFSSITLFVKYVKQIMD